MGVMCAQQPLESELLQRCQQLQSRLSTLKIENEEVGCLPASKSFTPLSGSSSRWVLIASLVAHLFRIR